MASVIRDRLARQSARLYRHSLPSEVAAAPEDPQRESSFPSDTIVAFDPMSDIESLEGAEGISTLPQSGPASTVSLFGGADSTAQHHHHEQAEAGPSSTYASQPIADTFFDNIMARRGRNLHRATNAGGTAAAVLNIMEQAGYGLGRAAAAALGRPGIDRPWRGEGSPERRKKQTTSFATELHSKNARALLLYDSSEPDARANDVWPDLRTASKRPARYYRLKKCGSKEFTDSGAAKDAASGLAALDLASSELDAAETSVMANHGQQGATDVADRDVAMGSSLSWPAAVLPTEIYENIAGNLCRDDVKSMRLVCREFDKHVSQVLFKRAVVPFNSEIYGMLTPGNPDPKGKKKASSLAVPLWAGSDDDDIFTGHGLDVFRGFGEHILKFGMSFEIDEDALAAPPSKCLLETRTGFWGNYEWPYQEYRRYSRVAGLENTADETPRMTVAFSELTKVRELALSVDSGLGWLSGPDRSIRSQILSRRPAIFDCQDTVPDRQLQAQRELWDYIRSCHSNDELKSAGLCKLSLATKDLMEWPEDLSLSRFQPSVAFLEQRLIQEAVEHGKESTDDKYACLGKGKAKESAMYPRPPGTTHTGILFTIPDDADDKRAEGFLKPNCLTTAQKEWLMETDWAQRAFMSSYVLSIMDNPVTFENVHTLSIARLSDRYLSSLIRSDFWDGLPNLHSVTIHAIPSWRDVYKDHAGFVHTSTLHPSSGINPFYHLLQTMISPRLNISHLTIGWVGGGEHAEGFHSRNKHLLPPPILCGTSETASSWDDIINGYDPSQLLIFPYVENLKLDNCWMTPNSLVDFVKAHDGKLLKKLTLQSVSLTTIPRPTQPVHHAPQFLPQSQWHQLNQLMGMISLQTHAANAPPAIPPLVASAPQTAPTATPQNVGMPMSSTMQQALQVRITNAQTAVQNVAWTPAGLTGLIAHVSGIAQALQQALQQFDQEQLQASNPSQAHPSQANFLQLHNQQLTAVTALTQSIHQLMVTIGGPPLPPQGQQPPNATTTASNLGNVLHTEFRRGSWVDVIDQISPGRNLADFGSDFSHAEPDRVTCLDQINFVSCGYAVLPHYTDMDQRVLMREDTSVTIFEAVAKRGEAVSQYMMSDKFPLLGKVVQRLDEEETEALEAGWDLEEGWEDSEAAEGPLFDGQLRGGTGRFTGVIRREAETQEAFTY